jgi:CIC family chloride channel protein
MGLVGTALVLATTSLLGSPAARFGVFGPGYGAAQAAVSGIPGVAPDWTFVALLAALFFVKLVATALSIGSGGVAGDFAPSIIMGGLLGGAFGHAAGLLLQDPNIDPAAFALVGMGTFYGGIAHAPISALVLVSELAGSYDLLVPMMLAGGVAFVALRGWTLYPAQPASKADSPALRDEAMALEPILATAPVRVRDLVTRAEIPAVSEASTVAAALAACTGARRQRIAVLVGDGGRPTGIVELGILAALARQGLGETPAGDEKVPFVSIDIDSDLEQARNVLESSGLPQLPVHAGDALVGLVGELQVLGACARAENGRREAHGSRSGSEL